VGEDRWKSLEVWKKADELAFRIYELTKRFPKEELYSLTSQIRRASLSIPTNIVEGYSRKGDAVAGAYHRMFLETKVVAYHFWYWKKKIGEFLKK
jgi:hypothetical protein